MVTLNKNGLHLCLMFLLLWLTFLVIKPCASWPIFNKNEVFFYVYKILLVSVPYPARIFVSLKSSISTNKSTDFNKQVLRVPCKNYVRATKPKVLKAYCWLLKSLQDKGH